MSKIFIGVPHTGELRAELASYLFHALTQHKEHEVELLMNEARPVDVNRNIIAREFLASDKDYLLMIDSDVVPPVSLIPKLLSHQKEVIGALCFTSQDGILTPLVMKKHEKGYVIDKEIKPLMKVDATGTGCLMIHRKVFEKMQKPYFHFSYDSDGVVSKGEDFNFIEKARELGFECWVDTSLMCRHFVTQDLLSHNFELLRKK